MFTRGDPNAPDDRGPSMMVRHAETRAREAARAADAHLRQRFPAATLSSRKMRCASSSPVIEGRRARMGNEDDDDGDEVKTEATMTIGGSEGDERRRVVNEVARTDEVAKRVVGVRETDGRIELTTTMVAGEIRAPP